MGERGEFDSGGGLMDIGGKNLTVGVSTTQKLRAPLHASVVSPSERERERSSVMALDICLDWVWRLAINSIQFISHFLVVVSYKLIKSVHNI